MDIVVSGAALISLTKIVEHVNIEIMDTTKPNRAGPNRGKRFDWLWRKRLSISHLKFYKSHPIARKTISKRLETMWREHPERFHRKKRKKVKSGRYFKVYNPQHHRADINGYVPEHILVMEKRLGRHILKSEVVHHLNGDNLDNRAKNLVAIPFSEHSRHHALHQKLGTRSHWIKKLRSEGYIVKKIMEP